MLRCVVLEDGWRGREDVCLVDHGTLEDFPFAGVETPLTVGSVTPVDQSLRAHVKLVAMPRRGMTYLAAMRSGNARSLVPGCRGVAGLTEMNRRSGIGGQVGHP